MNKIVRTASPTRWSWLARLGLASSLAAAVLGQAPAAAAGVLEVANACDQVITKDVAPAGTTIVLGGPAVHTCVPGFDPVTGRLLAGNGISVDAEGVTLDLNGRSIQSASDVAADARAVNPLLSVSNTGVAVGGRNNRLINSSPVASVVDNFTGNYVVRAQDSTVVGSLTDAGYNLVAGHAHGGGALTLLASLRVIVDTVQLQDLSANGDLGLDVRRSESVTIKNSRIEGATTGARVRDSKFVSLMSNAYISGHQGTGVELRATEGTLILGNTIGDNLADGVKIAGDTKFTFVANNTVQNDGGCGIRIALAAQSFSIAPNVFLNNPSADVCFK